MIAIVLGAKNTWRSLSPERRRATAALLAILAVSALAAGRDWTGDKRQRLQKEITAADVRYIQVRDAIAQIQRLRGQAPPSSAQTRISPELMLVTLRRHGLEPTARNEGIDKIRLQGSANFDQLIEGLAVLHRDDKWRLISLTVSRENGEMRFDAVLTADTP